MFLIDENDFPQVSTKQIHSGYYQTKMRPTAKSDFYLFWTPF